MFHQLYSWDYQPSFTHRKHTFIINAILFYFIFLILYSSFGIETLENGKKCKYAYGYAYDFSIGNCLKIESKTNGFFWVPMTGTHQKYSFSFKYHHDSFLFFFLFLPPLFLYNFFISPRFAYLFFTTEFTYQFWIKPYILNVERTQFIIGNLVYDEARQYNNGLIIRNDELHFFVGNNFFDADDYSDSKCLLFSPIKKSN